MLYYVLPLNDTLNLKLPYRKQVGVSVPQNGISGPRKTVPGFVMLLGEAAWVWGFWGMCAAGGSGHLPLQRVCKNSSKRRSRSPLTCSARHGQRGR